MLVADTTGRVLHRVAGRVPVRDGSSGRGPAGRAAADRGPPDGVAVSANDRTDERWDVLADASPRRGAATGSARCSRRPDRRRRGRGQRADRRPRRGRRPVARPAPRPAGPARAEPRRGRAAARLGPLDGRGLRRGRDLRRGPRRRGRRASSRTRCSTPPVRHPHRSTARCWRRGGTCPVASRALLPDLVVDPPAGLDLDAIARAALAEVAAVPPRTWGDRHRIAPQHALADLGLDPTPHLPSVAGQPLGGDTDCVAATAWIPGTDAGRDRSDRPPRLGPRRPRRAAAGPCHSAPPASPATAHHDDQFTAWKDGTLHPVGSPPTVTLRPVVTGRRRTVAARLVHRSRARPSGGWPRAASRRSRTSTAGSTSRPTSPPRSCT